MVEIKIERQEILFRVVFAGGEAATKFATIRGLHDGLPSEETEEITVLHAGGDRIVGFRHRPPSGSRLFDMDVSMHALTIPGTLRTPANETLLLRSADAIIYLDDREIRDREGAEERFAALLRRLGDLGREPGDLPVFVQCYGDGPASRAERFRATGRPWPVEVRRNDRGDADSGALFREVQDRILESYRGYERELERRGLRDHIKIRDRIYEKVFLDAALERSREGAAEPRREVEVRLIQSLDGELPSPRRWWLAGAVALVIAAVLLALLVSFEL